MTSTPAPTTGDQRRAPVQRETRMGKPRGTLAWSEHEEAWREYHRHHPTQDTETIAARGGFGYAELVTYLDREPATWEPS